MRPKACDRLTRPKEVLQALRLAKQRALKLQQKASRRWRLLQVLLEAPSGKRLELAAAKCFRNFQEFPQSFIFFKEFRSRFPLPRKAAELPSPEPSQERCCSAKAEWLCRLCGSAGCANHETCKCTRGMALSLKNLASKDWQIEWLQVYVIEKLNRPNHRPNSLSQEDPRCSKIDRIVQYVENFLAADPKVQCLIVSQWASTIRKLEEALQAKGLEYFRKEAPQTSQKSIVLMTPYFLCERQKDKAKHLANFYQALDDQCTTRHVFFTNAFYMTPVKGQRAGVCFRNEFNFNALYCLFEYVRISECIHFLEWNSKWNHRSRWDEKPTLTDSDPSRSAFGGQDHRLRQTQPAGHRPDGCFAPLCDEWHGEPGTGLDTKKIKRDDVLLFLCNMFSSFFNQADLIARQTSYFLNSFSKLLFRCPPPQKSWWNSVGLTSICAHRSCILGNSPFPWCARLKPTPTSYRSTENLWELEVSTLVTSVKFMGFMGIQCVFYSEEFQQVQLHKFEHVKWQWCDLFSLWPQGWTDGYHGTKAKTEIWEIGNLSLLSNSTILPGSGSHIRPAPFVQRTLSANW